MKKGLKKFFKKINWGILFLSLVTVYGTALLGSLFTSPGVKSFWYMTVRPSITPPDIVFPITWNILFFLIFISLYISLTKVKDKKTFSKIEIAFGINFLLNFLWSFFYFGLRNPLFAFLDLIFLFFSILAMIRITWKINRKASWLLFPYLLWILFAGLLNYLSIFR
jgi:tryptophan-rich sensory protein